jgi:Zn-dependent protease
MVSSWYDTFAQIALMVPAFVIAVSFHEYAHSLVSTFLGDDTSKRMGRLTLNPIAHIDFLGMVFLFIFRIGWAKPVIFDPRNFKYPRFYTVIVSLAGPFSNFLIALICFYMVAYFPLSLFSFAVSKSLLQVLSVIAYVNVMLGCFNLLPIPPLDGSHIITVFLAKRFPQVVLFFQRYSIIMLLMLFMLPGTRFFLVKMIITMQRVIKFLVI